MAAKDFGPIESDYAFFMSHATEAVNDVAEYVKQLEGFAPNLTTATGSSIQILDFGCGTGEFSSGLFSELNWSPELLQLTVVEPVAHQRAVAVQRLSVFSHHPVHDFASLPAAMETQFDLAIANHVLYYVENLSRTLDGICQLVRPGGKLLLAMAGWDNPLMQLWKFGFGLLGQPVPYYSAEDVEAILAERRLTYRTSIVPYELRFEDTRENRLRVLRFLFGEYLGRIDSEQLLNQFEPYVEGAFVEVNTHSRHFVVEPVRVHESSLPE